MEPLPVCPTRIVLQPSGGKTNEDRISLTVYQSSPNDKRTPAETAWHKRIISCPMLGASQLLCASFVVFATLAGCSTKEEKPAPPPPSVTIASVVQKEVPIHQEWVGTMAGNVDAEIRPKVEGFLLTRLYAEGSFVAKGAAAVPVGSASDQSSGGTGHRESGARTRGTRAGADRRASLHTVGGSESGESGRTR